MVEYFTKGVLRDDLYFCGEIRRFGGVRYILRLRRCIRYRVSRNPFRDDRPVDEDSANVNAEQSKGASTTGPEVAARGGIRC